MTSNEGTALAEAVKELNRAILALRTLIERDYPNRREVEASFVRKSESAVHLKWMLVLVVVTTMLSFGATVGLMSSCFIMDDRPSACHIIPGFEDLEARRMRNDDIVERVEELEKR